MACFNTKHFASKQQVYNLILEIVQTQKSPEYTWHSGLRILYKSCLLNKQSYRFIQVFSLQLNQVYASGIWCKTNALVLYIF